MPRLQPRNDLQDILQDRLERFTKTLPGVEEGDVRAVHQARVASRRLREIVPLLPLERDLSRKLVKKLRRVTRGLGHVRELDVLVGLTGDLQVSGRYADRALKTVTADVRRARDKERRRFERERHPHKLRRTAKKLERHFKKIEFADSASSARRADRRHSWRWALDARVARRARGLANTIEAAGSVYLADRLHAVRIALKKLRYGVEVASEAGATGGAELPLMKRMQELLGRLHDLQVLLDRVRSVQAANEKPNATAAQELGALVSGLEQSCRRVHARYMRDRHLLVEACDRLMKPEAAKTRAAKSIVAADVPLKPAMVKPAPVRVREAV